MQDVACKWIIGVDGKKESEKSVSSVQLKDDDIYIYQPLCTSRMRRKVNFYA